MTDVATRPPSAAVATVERYRDDFAALLPSHVDPDTFVRVAVGALRRNPDLRAAAEANIGSFMGALADAARLGLEPGTEQFWLTPRKVKGRLEVLGIIGAQGIVELMYRAGAVQSIVAEVVRTGDTFDYQPGRDDRPRHVIDWDAADRGQLRLVYAYAIMQGGAVSKVVVLNKAQIDAIKKSSATARSDYSPWNTHPEAMWLKSAVRQLRKWTPTSAEYIRERMRAARDVAAEPVGTTKLPPRDDLADLLDESDDPLHYEPDEYVDAEIVDDNALEQGEGTA